MTKRTKVILGVIIGAVIIISGTIFGLAKTGKINLKMLADVVTQNAGGTGNVTINVTGQSFPPGAAIIIKNKNTGTEVINRTVSIWGDYQFYNIPTGSYIADISKCVFVLPFDVTAGATISSTGGVIADCSPGNNSNPPVATKVAVAYRIQDANEKLIDGIPIYYDSVTEQRSKNPAVDNGISTGTFVNNGNFLDVPAGSHVFTINNPSSLNYNSAYQTIIESRQVQGNSQNIFETRFTLQKSTTSGTQTPTFDSQGIVKYENGDYPTGNYVKVLCPTNSTTEKTECENKLSSGSKTTNISAKPADPNYKISDLYNINQTGSTFSSYKVWVQGVSGMYLDLNNDGKTDDNEKSKGSADSFYYEFTLNKADIAPASGSNSKSVAIKDFVLKNIPSGDATITGKVTDKNGEPISSFPGRIAGVFKEKPLLDPANLSSFESVPHSGIDVDNAINYKIEHLNFMNGEQVYVCAYINTITNDPVANNRPMAACHNKRLKIESGKSYENVDIIFNLDNPKNRDYITVKGRFVASNGSFPTGKVSVNEGYSSDHTNAFELRTHLKRDQRDQEGSIYLIIKAQIDNSPFCFVDFNNDGVADNEYNLIVGNYESPAFGNIYLGENGEYYINFDIPVKTQYESKTKFILASGRELTDALYITYDGSHGRFRERFFMDRSHNNNENIQEYLSGREFSYYQDDPNGSYTVYHPIIGYLQFKTSDLRDIEINGQIKKGYYLTSKLAAGKSEHGIKFIDSITGERIDIRNTESALSRLIINEVDFSGAVTPATNIRFSDYDYNRQDSPLVFFTTKNDAAQFTVSYESDDYISLPFASGFTDQDPATFDVYEVLLASKHRSDSTVCQEISGVKFCTASINVGYLNEHKLGAEKLATLLKWLASYSSPSVIPDIYLDSGDWHSLEYDNRGIKELNLPFLKMAFGLIDGYARESDQIQMTVEAYLSYYYTKMPESFKTLFINSGFRAEYIEINKDFAYTIGGMILDRVFWESFFEGNKRNKYLFFVSQVKKYIDIDGLAHKFQQTATAGQSVQAQSIAAASLNEDAESILLAAGFEPYTPEKINAIAGAEYLTPDQIASGVWLQENYDKLQVAQKVGLQVSMAYARAKNVVVGVLDKTAGAINKSLIAVNNQVNRALKVLGFKITNSSISGKLLDQNSYPLSKYIITIAGQSAVTNNKGEFTLTKLATGDNWEVEVTNPAIDKKYTTGRVIKVTDGMKLTDQVFYIQRPLYKLNIQVIISSTDKPLANGSLLIDGKDKMQLDAKGKTINLSNWIKEGVHSITIQNSKGKNQKIVNSGTFGDLSKLKVTGNLDSIIWVK